MQVETRLISKLTADPENARTHDKKNLDAIASSLEKFGQVKPIAVTRTGVVLAGNGTLRAAESLGWSEISVVVVPESWDYATAKAYALADNRTAELAEWDTSVLASQLVELDSVGWDVSELGFERLEPPTDPEFLPSDEEQPRLDERSPTTCPHCQFTWRVGAKGEINPA
jgi:ParB-like chromosome segregation protein Spo0J